MSSIRINKEELIELTGKQQTSAQVKWFKQHLNINIACDAKGPILNHAIYSELLKKQYGLIPEAPNAVKRPQVILRN
ncbi:DUF4224 domain-containing protein [Janthinobacterium sp. B9-8]|uniref:DUF4224 domain-containing protein n=1 Tax=Janthinobacterium sp. B9-8 TaxID=1236179 RepID=UPI00061CE36A|nr:DUF4224 domain-containing protein [Janthinobacterium sp. B9-8]AMC35402.1 hypothetical protein VN23_12655 [Janthinobacterium sp. B9-8]